MAQKPGQGKIGDKQYRTDQRRRKQNSSADLAYKIRCTLSRRLADDRTVSAGQRD
jgi:hypothetical protein